MPEEELSLEETMKEFNQMISSGRQCWKHHEQVTEVEKTVVPTWAKILGTVVLYTFYGYFILLQLRCLYKR